MSYRHRIVKASPEMRNLATAASQVAAQWLPLAYRPQVFHFCEDPAGRYEREVRCSGFVDLGTDEELAAFVRDGLSPAKTVETIFHECCHIQQSVSGAFRSREMIEYPEARHSMFEMRADSFARKAPQGDIMTALNYEIEIYVSARGDPQTIADTRARRARNGAEQRQWIEMLQRQSRYRDLDDDDDEETGEDVAPPARVQALDILTLVKAEGYLKDVAEHEQQRAIWRKEREEAEARWAHDRAVEDAKHASAFNYWNDRLLGNGR